MINSLIVLVFILFINTILAQNNEIAIVTELPKKGEINNLFSIHENQFKQLNKAILDFNKSAKKTLLNEADVEDYFTKLMSMMNDCLDVFSETGVFYKNVSELITDFKVRKQRLLTKSKQYPNSDLAKKYSDVADRYSKLIINLNETSNGIRILRKQANDYYTKIVGEKDYYFELVRVRIAIDTADKLKDVSDNLKTLINGWAEIAEKLPKQLEGVKTVY